MTKAKATTVPATIATRVREVREHRGLSLRQTSEALAGVDHQLDASALMRLEKGERRASIEDVLALAIVLDVSPDALLVPLDDGRQVALTPSVARNAGKVRDWIAGRHLILPPVPEDEMLRRRQAWRSERPLVEQRAFEQPGVAALETLAHQYVQAVGRAPDTTGSMPAPGERRRALEALREEVDRQLSALLREEG